MMQEETISTLSRFRLPIPGAKRHEDSNELAFIILYSHTFCWQNQNQFDLEFSIVINIRKWVSGHGRSMNMNQDLYGRDNRR